VHYARHIAIDLVRALGVLALIFLSFGHAPVPAATYGHEVLTAVVDLSFCGDAPAGNDGSHAPCHACRIGAGADLPPPCGGLLHVAVATTPDFAETELAPVPRVATGLPEARGPPRLA
jgi:hypothetical protein